MDAPRTRDRVLAPAVAPRFATFWPRAWARTLDLAIFWLLGWGLSDAPRVAPPTVLATAQALAPVAYSILLHGWYGRTVGKWIMGVEVLDVTERPLSLRQAVLRDSVVLALTVLGLAATLAWPLPELAELQPEDVATLTFHWLSGVHLLVLLGWLGWYALEFATVALDDRRRAFHDLIAGSVVVRTRTSDPWIANGKFALLLLLGGVLAGFVWLMAPR